MNTGPSLPRIRSAESAPCQSEIPAQYLEPPAGVGHRHTRLVAGASTRAFGGALVGVEGHQRSVVEDRLAHDQGAVDRCLDQYRFSGRRALQLRGGGDSTDAA